MHAGSVTYEVAASPFPDTFRTRQCSLCTCTIERSSTPPTFLGITTNRLVLYFQVTMSYLEIYNEHIRDLLAPDNGTLDLRDDSKKGIHVAGLTEASTTSTKEVKFLTSFGTN